MSRRPAFDERIVLPIRAAPSRERILLDDLWKYLGTNKRLLWRFARKTGLLRKRETVRDKDWVTPQGAMRIILHIRAHQQASYEAGHSVHEQSARRRSERLRRNCLAKLGAGTDAEPQRGCRKRAEAVGEAVAETPAVSLHGSTAKR